MELGGDGPPRDAFAVMQAGAVSLAAAETAQKAKPRAKPREGRPSPSGGVERQHKKAKYTRHNPMVSAASPFPLSGPVRVPLDQCLPAQRDALVALDEEGKLPDWVVVCANGLACSTCIAAQKAVTFGPIKKTHPWINTPSVSKDVLQAIHSHEHGQCVSRAELRAGKLKCGGKIPPTRHKLSSAHLSENETIINGARLMHKQEEAAIKKRLRAVYWLAKENNALAK